LTYLPILVPFPSGTKKFSLLKRVNTGSGAHPARYLIVAACEQPGNEYGQSSSSSAKVKNALIYTSSLSFLRGLKIIFLKLLCPMALGLNPASAMTSWNIMTIFLRQKVDI